MHTLQKINKDIFSSQRTQRVITTFDEIIKLLIFDKKNEFGKVQFTLLDGIGKVKLNQETNNELIIKAFKDYNI